MLNVGSPPIPVRLRKNQRARRLTLRVSSVDGAVTLTMPPKTHRRQAQKFLEQQEGWIRQRLATTPKRVVVQAGIEMVLQDEPLTLTPHSGARVVLAPGKLMIPQGKHPGTLVEAFLKRRLRVEISDLVARYAMLLGQKHGRISLRDPRSRWGSCASNGGLMFSWRLILAPQKVLEYVVAHEVAHLAEMNHSAAFWQLVEALMPDFDQHRQWLREHGAALHRYDFKSGA